MGNASQAKQDGLPLDGAEAPPQPDATEPGAVTEPSAGSEEVVEVEGEVVDEGSEEAAIVAQAVTDLNPEALANLATDDQIEKAIRTIIARTKAVKKYKAAMLSLTNVFDWYAHVSEGDPDGRPYLTKAGAEKVKAAFGIEVDIQRSERVQCDPETGGYEYVFEGRMRALAFSDIWYYVVGSRWSDDGFFTRGGARTADPGDVRKAAHTNWENRGIKACCGIQTLTWEELEKLPGLKDLRNRCTKIGYSGGSGPKAEPGELSDIEKGPHIKVRIPYEDSDTRDALKKLPKADRLWNKVDKYWVVRYSKKYLGTVADLHATNPKVSFRPFNVAKEDLP